MPGQKGKGPYCKCGADARPQYGDPEKIIAEVGEDQPHRTKSLIADLDQHSWLGREGFVAMRKSVPGHFVDHLFRDCDAMVVYDDDKGELLAVLRKDFGFHLGEVVSLRFKHTDGNAKLHASAKGVTMEDAKALASSITDELVLSVL
jgi:hypothetical protein